MNHNDNGNDASKKRFINILEKKFKTTMIGALSVFEDEFGELWGHGLQESQLTEEQKYFRQQWENARTRILDAGNSNLRATQNELSRYSLHWNRYVTNFHFKKEQ